MATTVSRDLRSNYQLNAIAGHWHFFDARTLPQLVASAALRTVRFPNQKWGSPLLPSTRQKPRSWRMFQIMASVWQAGKIVKRFCLLALDKDVDQETNLSH